MKMNQTIRRLAAVVMTALMVSSMVFTLGVGASRTYAADEVPTLTATATKAGLTKYGNIDLSLTKEEVFNAGYELGDMVTVKFLDQSLDIPFCQNYSDVDSGTPAFLATASGENVSVAINMGNFAQFYGIATKVTNEDNTYEWHFNEGVEEPVTFTISMKEKGGYLDEYIMRQLSYTNERADYPDLSDEQFANFRVVNTTGMGKHTLYRTTSPIDNSRGRAAYSDAAIKNARVSVVVNLSDTSEEITQFEGYEGSYYSTTKYVGLNMGVDFMAQEFKVKFAQGLKFMAENPGIYAVHCLEGKDRTGFTIAVMECLMGASYDEVVEDYMVTFSNYYGVEKGDPRYDAISTSNIVKSLQTAFGVSDLKSANLAAEAEEYMKEIGLTADEIAALKVNLAADNHYYGDVSQGAAVAPTCTERGFMPGLKCLICGEVSQEEKVLEPLGHDWGEWVVTKEATETQEGEKKRVCKRDETHVEVEKIPVLKAEVKDDETKKPTGATPQDATKKPAATTGTTTATAAKTNAPKTADNTNLALWLVLMSGAAVSAAMGYTKMKKRG